MSGPIEEKPQSQQEREAETQEKREVTKMSEVESSQATAASEAPKKPMDFSFTIWPPTQKTRDAVINRLIETLSTPSILSTRYGTVSPEEASEIAKRIEEEAFNTAAAAASADDDGIEILQVYSKEISKRMLDTVKSRSGAAAPESKPFVEGEEVAVACARGEEVSDAKTEP